MKPILLLAAGLFALSAVSPELTREAQAYSSAVGVDPDKSGVGNGEAGPTAHDIETKAIKKSATAGKSQALIPGLVVAYSSEADGYTVTRAVTGGGPGQMQLACVTLDDVATGDTGYHRCITKGFARVRYNIVDATRGITAGRQACVDAGGRVQGCAMSGTDSSEATANTGIIPLESKASGSGTDLKVMLQLR